MSNATTISKRMSTDEVVLVLGKGLRTVRRYLSRYRLKTDPGCPRLAHSLRRERFVEVSPVVLQRFAERWGFALNWSALTEARLEQLGVEA